MKEIIPKIGIIILFTSFILLTSCDTSIMSDEEDSTRVKIINNTGSTITVYYAQEEYYNDEYDFRSYSKNISIGGSEYIRISEINAFKYVTIVEGASATTYPISGDTLSVP